MPKAKTDIKDNMGINKKLPTTLAKVTQPTGQPPLSIDELFKLADLYFKQPNILYSHQHKSFDKFLDEDVKNVLKKGDNIFFEKLTKDKVIRYKFEYDDIAIQPPSIDKDSDELMFPSDARTRSMTYSVGLVATVTQIQETIDIATDEVIRRVIGHPEHDVLIATIPLMVRSKYCSLNLKKGYDKSECEYDPGGYFIVNGSEKVVMALERMCDNRPLVFTKKDAQTIIYQVQVNSRSYGKNPQTQIISVRMKRDNTMTIRVPILKEVSVIILFRALGIESDRDIINYITYDEDDTEMVNLAKLSLEQSVDERGNRILTRDDAINYMINKMKVTRKYIETDKDLKYKQRRMHLIELLETSFLPHVEGGMTEKAYYLGYMINRLFNTFLGRRKVDDRDSYINKRVDLPGTLVEELFKQLYRKMLSECNKFFNQRYGNNDDNPLNIINQIRPNTIEQGLKTALLTGAWNKRKGVAQMLQRLTYLYTLSSLRRINSPTMDASTNKLTSPRHLHPTQAGFVCIVETPEGIKVGLVKNLALTGNITVMMMSQIFILKSKIKDHIIDLKDLHPREYQIQTKVFLNGEWLGMTKTPLKLYNELKKDKTNNIVDKTVGIVYDIDNNEIRVFCDGGRLYRPLLCVDDNQLLIKREHLDMVSINDPTSATKITRWNDFLIKNAGTIEYLDSEESCYLMIAEDQEKLELMHNRMYSSIKRVKTENMTNIINRYDDMTFVRYTHCEIHPALLLGIVASNIPFCNHNQGPRNIFQYSQARQAMGIYTSNYRDRLDISYILYNPHKPLITTRTMKYINSTRLPAGENCIVAIASYTGYNQEDSLIINQSAIDRGLFRSSSLKKYMSVIAKNQSTSQDDIFMKPDPSQVTGMRHGSYDKLNEKGYIPAETKVVNGDILIGKVSPIQAEGQNNKIYKDGSEMYKSHVSGYVDKVYDEITNHEGYPMIKMRVRSERVPHIGDKLCCYDEETEILTTDGWVYFRDLTMEHQVATLQDGKRLEYKKPTKLWSYDYEGDMYKVESKQVNLLVTPNHRMWVGNRTGTIWGIRVAEECYGKQLKYMKNIEETQFDHANENGGDIDFYVLKATDKLPQLKLDMDAWLVFLGIWIAEGCMLRDWGVSFATHKQRVKDALTDICGEKKLNFEIRKHKNQVDDEIKNAWCFNDRRVVNFFQAIVAKAVDKQLPAWCLKLNKRQSRLLIDGMMLGDGHTMDNGTRRYDTSSTVLANQFQALCLHAGYSCNKSCKYEAGHVAKGKTKTITSTVDAWRLTIIESQNTPLVNKYVAQKSGGIQLDSWVKNYKGKVYCCQVTKLTKSANTDNYGEGDKDDKGIVYVRRGGCPVWSGNSRHGQKGTIGNTLPAAYMPFTESGLQPDIIVNPNAFPKRMTLGQLVECLTGKVAAIRGHTTDGTPFNNIDVEAVKQELEALGYERNGFETMYNGMTGKKLTTQIFIGPTYYQRLKHMVADKIHCLEMDHEVLTSTGWKFYHDLTMDSEVATLDNGELKYTKPTNLLYYPDFTGQIYHVQTPQVDLAVTLNHRMWVSKYDNAISDFADFGFELSENIVGWRVRYQKNANWNLADQGIISPSALNLCGSLMAVQWILVTGGENDDHINRVSATLRMNTEQLERYIEQCNQETVDKCFPDWIWQLTQAQCRTLMGQMSATDTYNTKQEIFADELTRLALHCGWSANKTNSGDIWTVEINKTDNTPEINNDYLEEIYDYAAPVFCLEVPSGVFYVRRNGLSVWTGNSRSRGPVTLLTRQPLEGRSRDGGLRFGEMERDSVIAHGMAKFLKERMMETADATSTYVCDKCGLFAQRKRTAEVGSQIRSNDVFWCPSCKNSTEISKIMIPYAFKLLVQELMSMSIAPRIRVKKDKYSL